jgi:hypothetical protein
LGKSKICHLNRCLPQTIAKDLSVRGPSVRVALAVAILVGGGCPDSNLRLILWVRVGKSSSQKCSKDYKGFHFLMNILLLMFDKFATDGFVLKSSEFYSLTAMKM